MTTTLNRPAVPTVSLAQEASDPEAFAQALGGSFHRYGFAIVSDHGVPSEIIAEAEAQAKRFFALPEEVKRAYHTGKGGARGYTPFGIETAKDATAYDLKEFWHVGRELPEGHPFADMMAPNLWPDELADFKEFTWPMAPTVNGAPTDVRIAPKVAPLMDQTTSLMDKSRRLVYVTALHPGRQTLLGYVFRREEYPWTQMWDFYPGGGRRSQRGMEFAVQPFDLPRRDVIQAMRNDGTMRRIFEKYFPADLARQMTQF